MRFETLPVVRRDPGQVGASLARLGDQLLDGWRQSQGLELPERYHAVDRIAVLGTGGSHLGADIVRSVWAAALPGPVQIIADYGLPAWVNRQTLVMASSYSGNTEETLESLKLAVKRRLPTVVVTTGGRLGDAARYYRLPHIQFVPSANPSGQPRLGIGYSLSAIVTILRTIGWLKKSDLPINAMAAAAEHANRKFGPAIKKNAAKDLARDLVGRIPILVGAEWMTGNLHTLANQIHENAKTYAAWYRLPDLNHHLLEGLRNRAVTRQMRAVFFHHPSVHPRTQIRMRLTQRLMQRLGAKTSVIRLTGDRPVAAVEMLAFGGYASWYLAAARRVQPALIPTVDELKAALGRA